MPITQHFYLSRTKLQSNVIKQQSLKNNEAESYTCNSYKSSNLNNLEMSYRLIQTLVIAHSAMCIYLKNIINVPITGCFIRSYNFINNKITNKDCFITSSRYWGRQQLLFEKKHFWHFWSWACASLILPDWVS